MLQIEHISSSSLNSYVHNKTVCYIVHLFGGSCYLIAKTYRENVLYFEFEIGKCESLLEASKNEGSKDSRVAKSFILHEYKHNLFSWYKEGVV